jgi:DNA/RNA-binding domain of Phe-tRNA-synthetase-like protein
VETGRPGTSAIIEVAIAPHPFLEAGIIQASLPAPLGEIPSPPDLIAALGAAAEHVRDDATVAAVRRLLRHGGYRPAGRGKPASEYLVQAAERGTLASINPVVDACNAASLWGGLPISVIDLDRAALPLRIDIAAAGERYVFNSAGQEIDLAGLLVLRDAAGACANAVKDAQRTKTGSATRRVLGVVWGTAELPGRTRAVRERFAVGLAAAGASVALR